MALIVPEDTNDLFYFTRRSIGDGKAMAWVYKPTCPKCSKAKMGKPVDEKTGKVKIRAKEYVCPSCKYTAQKEEFEETCTMEILFTCPHCKKEGEATTLYKLKSFDGIKAYVFECPFCKKKIGITKKMKSGKSAGDDDAGDD
ncbi:hypothetical protein HY636_03550 [Candidatus Woesearchaeota archaeon]|nr:hypothetical protein [Candidatus Woesearchaeota archaeon]